MILLNFKLKSTWVIIWFQIAMRPFQSIISDDNLDSFTSMYSIITVLDDQRSQLTIRSQMSALTLPDSRVAFLPRSFDVVASDSPLILEARIVEEAFRVVTG